MFKVMSSFADKYTLPYTKLWTTEAIPAHAGDQYVRFIKRCQKYFKPDEIRVYQPVSNYPLSMCPHDKKTNVF